MMRTDPTTLILNNVDVGYRTPLIQNANARLDAGTVCLLMGNNGVGKTTLLKSILNQVPVLSGSILIGKSAVKNLSASQIAQEIAVVFSKGTLPQNYTVHDLISVGKFIHYPFYFRMSPEDAREIDTIIQLLKLEKYRHFPLHQLSDGNLQKAFIGRALAQNSPVIILDEPTTHLDEENKIALLQLLRDLAKKQNKIILFSSHDWRLAKEFADHLWLLHDGKLHAGIAEEVLLRNHAVLNPKMFGIADGFIAPTIEAPTLQREMLFSFLQKHVAQDLSVIRFEWLETEWAVHFPTQQKIAKNFEEILSILQAIR